MKLGNREYGFVFTVGTSIEISKLCPNGDIEKMETVLNHGTFEQRMKLIATMAHSMSKAFENKKHKEDETYQPQPLTVEEIYDFSMTQFNDLVNEIMAVANEDKKPSIETEEIKTKKNENPNG